MRLTEERWLHVTAKHPEMEGQKERTLEALSEPDMIQEGDLGTLIAIRSYEKTPAGAKHLAVVYREVSEEDGFVVTAYLTRRPSRERAVLWTRP